MRRLRGLLRIVGVIAIGFTECDCEAATFGNTTPFEFYHSNNFDYVYGDKVAVTEPLKLISFGLIYGHPDLVPPVSSNAIFGVYDSDGENGGPGALLANTSIVNVSDNATHTFDFQTNPVISPGGYWMMALYENIAHPRVDAANLLSDTAYFPQPFDSGMPAVAPESQVGGFRGRVHNYWINGITVPEPIPVVLFLQAASITALISRRQMRKC